MKKLKRPSGWHIAFWLLMLAMLPNTVRDMREPDFWQFFGFWIGVLAVVGAVGSLVALLLVGFRKMAGSSEHDPWPRLTR